MKHIFFFIAIMGIISSCGNMGKNDNNAGSNTDGRQRTAKTKQGIQSFYDKVINGHNVAMVDSFCSADFKEHQIYNPKNPSTRDGMKAELTEWFAGLSWM